MYPFFFKIVHYDVNKTESLSTYIFSKIAVLSPILSTKRLATMALESGVSIICYDNPKWEQPKKEDEIRDIFEGTILTTSAFESECSEVTCSCSVASV